MTDHEHMTILGTPRGDVVLEPRDFFCWKCLQHYSMWVTPGGHVVVEVLCGRCGVMLTATQDEPLSSTNGE
jgi:hypothetical protein